MTIDYSTIDTDRGDQGNVYIYGYHWTCLFKGSLEAKLPTIWTDGKGTARKKLGRGESQKGSREKCGPGGSKGRLPKRRVRRKLAS